MEQGKSTEKAGSGAGEVRLAGAPAGSGPRLQGSVLIAHKIQKDHATLPCFKPHKEENKTTTFRINPSGSLHLRKKL